MGKQGKSLSPDFKKAIVTIKQYFDRTKKDVAESSLSSIDKTSHALNVGVSTVNRTMAEYNKNPLSIDVDKFERGKPPYIMADSLQVLTRDYIRAANAEGKHITLNMLSNHLAANSNAKEFSIRTLGRALDRWGFTFGKGTRSQHLKEKDHVVAARRRYLREMRLNRKGSETIRPEVYLDESYVNKNHSNDFTWYLEDDGPFIQKPTGKGERLIIINAITKDSWVPGAKLVFKSNRKTGDYHGQMNYELFTKWFTEMLLPNIPKNSLIIMDNASYHNVLSDNSDPTASSSKAHIFRWLQERGASIYDDMLKAELVQIMENMVTSPTFALDEIAADKGHKVLRTPPYHPELQPIEVCWGVVKNAIARNCDFTMSGLEKQLNLAFNSVTKKTCSGIVKKVREFEDNYWKEDTASGL